MALTSLDAKTALIIIDLQKGIVSLPTAHLTADVVKHAVLLINAFHRRDLPVVLVNVAGGAPGRAEQTRRMSAFPPDWTDLVPELELAARGRSNVHRVTKRTWGAFTNTGLEAYLKNRGVTQVVIAGVSTSAGVESTARYAHELGFNVTLAIDAMTDTNLDAHINSITRIFPRIGESGTTQQIIDLLGKAS